jgi:5'-methylthioadenosine phosphorylase
VPLASELGMGTANLSFVTDSDAGLAPAASLSAEDAANEVSHELVMKRLMQAQPRIVAAIETIIRAIPSDYEARELIPRSEVDAVLAREPA